MNLRVLYFHNNLQTCLSLGLDSGLNENHLLTGIKQHISSDLNATLSSCVTLSGKRRLLHTFSLTLTTSSSYLPVLTSVTHSFFFSVFLTHLPPVFISSSHAAGPTSRKS